MNAKTLNDIIADSLEATPVTLADDFYPDIIKTFDATATIAQLRKPSVKPRIIPNPTAEKLVAEMQAGNPGDDAAFFHVGHNRLTGERLTASISGLTLNFYYGADLRPVDMIDVGEDFLCGEIHISKFASPLIRFDSYLDRRGRQRANAYMVWN